MKKQGIALLLCLVLAVGMIAGCAAPAAQTGQPAASQTPAAEESAAPAQTKQAPETPEATDGLTDMLGNPVTVSDPEKIVSLTPAGTEIVCELGAAKHLVGIDAFSNYPEITGSIEVVGDYNGPDVEKIVALEPDVVLAGNTLQQEAIDQLAKLGIPVVSIEATTWEDIPKSVELTGAVIGAPEEAVKVTEEIASAVQNAQKAAPAEAPTVYYAMSYGDAGNWTSGPGSFLNSMIEIAGGKCVTEDAEYPWIEYPMEDLMVADPDIILVDASMGGAGSLAETPGYKDLSAVKDGRVYEIDADVFTRPGPRIAQAVAQLSGILNGTAEG